MMIEQNILKTALLGTNNYSFDKDIFSNEIQPFINENCTREACYLDGLTLYLAYYKAGIKLDKIENISNEIPTAPKEQFPLCSVEIENLLKMMLLEGSGSFISFFPNFIALVNKKEVVLPSKYFSKIATPNIDTINAFGERAKWIKSLEKGVLFDKEIDYLSMKKIERDKYFTSLIIAKDEEQIKLFLEALFDALTPAERLKYIRLVEVQNEASITAIAFFENYMNEKPEKCRNIKKNIYRLKLRDIKSEFFEQLYRDIFSKIWIKKRVNYTLLDGKELDELFCSLPFYTTIDESLEFILYITPIERWLTMMELEQLEFLKRVKKLKTTYIKENFFKAWMQQAIERKDKVLFYDLLELKVPIQNSGFVDIFERDELFTFILNNFNFLKSEKLALVDMVRVHPQFHQDWSSAFSVAFIKELIEGKTYYYKKEWTKAIWTIAPYLHMDGMDWLDKQLKSSKLASDFDDLEENFGTIMKIKELFNEIK